MGKMYKSLFQDVSTERKCWLCGRPATEWHHVFNASNKKNSEKYGAMVHLCHWCHNEPPRGVHHNKETRNYLCEVAQEKIMQEYGLTIDEFRAVFGKNYL